MSLGWALGSMSRRIGRLFGDASVVVDAVVTDSRTVRSGDVFVAIRGENFDGHDFAGAALSSGAVAVVTEEGRCEAEPRIEVASTANALLELAAMRREELAIPVVAVTGSTGKTTTKDMLAAAIPGAWASPSSFNNEVGVPLTVLQTPDDASALVVEMGSRGRGDIELLLPAVRPEVAVITNLGVVHLETFGDMGTLADAKWEVIQGIGADGTAVLPAVEPRLRRDHPGSTVTFGVELAADVAALDLAIDGEGKASFRLETPAGSADIKLRMPGVHQPANAASAAAAALAAGVDIDVIAAGLNGATGSKWRMEVHPGRFTVVNDAYNANPTSVEAALRTVAGLEGRHIAVLGQMAELGSVAAEEHLRIGRLAASLGFAAVVMVGEDPGLIEGTGSIGRRVESADKAYSVISRFVRSGDIILVKASRAVGLEGLAWQLIELAASTRGGAA